MKKAIIVLYNTEVSEIIRYRQMICNYEIVQVVSPSGWGLSQKDAGSVDGGKPTEYIIRDDIDYSIEFDVAFFTLTPHHSLIPQNQTLTPLIRSIPLNLPQHYF